MLRTHAQIVTELRARLDDYLTDPTPQLEAEVQRLLAELNGPPADPDGRARELPEPPPPPPTGEGGPVAAA